MAIPVYVDPTPEEVEVGGVRLLENFVQRRLQEEDLSSVLEHVPFLANLPPEAVGGAEDSGFLGAFENASTPALRRSLPEGFNNITLQDCGRILDALVASFQASHERNLIRVLAEQIPLANLQRENFENTVLNELFRNGINEYRIMTLFYFCSDLFVRCVRGGQVLLGVQLFTWIARYLVNNICHWVYEHGGWERVFSKVYTVTLRATTIAALAVLTLCGITFLKKNWF